MNKFILMQTPTLWISKKRGYPTIGLRELYPDKGYSSCDNYGFTDFIDPYGSKVAKFAFLDEESERAFKGEIETFNLNSEECSVVKLATIIKEKNNVRFNSTRKERV